MENNDNEYTGSGGFTVMDGARALMADAVVAHADYLCIAAGLGYRDDQEPVENLARLFVASVTDGDRAVTSPAHALKDALDGHLCFYDISPDVQEEAAMICLDLEAYWNGQRVVPLKQILGNILWHTDFNSVEKCPKYAARIGMLRQNVYAEINAKRNEWQLESARHVRISGPLKAGQVLKLHSSRNADGYEYALLVDGRAVNGSALGQWMFISLNQEDTHTLLNTIAEKPVIEVHVSGGTCPDTLFADTGCVYSLANDRIYDIVGEVDPPVLTAVRDVVNAHFYADRREAFGYGSCIQYRYEGALRYGIVVYIDDCHMNARLMDVFFLTEAEAAGDPAYIRLSKYTRDPDGELFYDFDFPENVAPYLKRGCVTTFQSFRDDASDIRRLGSWPNKAYANDRIRDLMSLFDKASDPVFDKASDPATSD